MQCSNSNTTTIPLAATPLCMVANIALDLPFGDVIFPQIFPISFSVLIEIANVSYTIVSATFVDGRTQANRLILPPPNLFRYIFYLVYRRHISLNSKTNGRKSKPPKP